MHKQGATVFAGCLSNASCEKLIRAVGDDRSRMKAVVLDVTKQEDVDRVKKNVEELGLPLLAVVNNAGAEQNI